MTIIDRRSLITGLKRKGCKLIRTTGSHEIWANETESYAVPIRMKPRLANKIAKQANLTYLFDTNNVKALEDWRKS